MNIYLIQFAIGCALICTAFWQYTKTESLLKRGKVALAEVIDLVTQSGSKGATYAPVFEYTDASQQIQRFKSEVASNPPAFQVGNKVPVVYDPADVSQVKVVSYWGLYRWAVIPLVIALPLLTISIGNWLFIWRFK